MVLFLEDSRDPMTTLTFQQIKTYQLIAEIVLIIFIVGALVYFYFNVEAVKRLTDDPCQVCMAKTGAKCYYGLGYQEPRSYLNSNISVQYRPSPKP